MAIAQAVQARMEAEQAQLGERSRVISDSIRVFYEKAFTDSIGRVIAAIRANALDMSERTRAGARYEYSNPLPTPRADERRVVVVPFAMSQSASRGSSGAPSGVGDQVADSIRALLAGRGTLRVVPESTTRDVMRVGRGVPSMIGTILEAPAVISGSYHRRGDSLVVRAQVTCVTCGSFGVRETVVPFAEAMTAVTRLYEPLVRDLNRVRWTPVTRGSGRATTIVPIPLPQGTRYPAPPPPARPPD